MKRVLMLSTVASLQDQFNMANIRMLRNLHCEVHVACNFVQGNNTSPQRIAVFQKPFFVQMHLIAFTVIRQWAASMGEKLLLPFRFR